MCLARHAKITQNKKFAISLQYLKKEVSDEVDFLHGNKHESFLQIDTMIFDGDGQAFPKFSKTKLKMKLILCMQIYSKVSEKLISRFWASKFSVR